MHYWGGACLVFLDFFYSCWMYFLRLLFHRVLIYSGDGTYAPCVCWLCFLWVLVLVLLFLLVSSFSPLCSPTARVDRRRVDVDASAHFPDGCLDLHVWYYPHATKSTEHTTHHSWSCSFLQSCASCERVDYLSLSFVPAASRIDFRRFSLSCYVNHTQLSCAKLMLPLVSINEFRSIVAGGYM